MSYLLAFLGFAALIILHEFGHFLAAKAVGMRVERFSLFFGPLLVKVQRGETEYGIGPIPLGGYVRITGMNPREEIPPEVLPRAYYNQPVWKRVVVILAGPAVNLLIAFGIVWALILTNGQSVATTRVAQIQPGTPAAAALHPGDRILSVDGVSGSETAIRNTIGRHNCAGPRVAGCLAATPAQVVVSRGGQEMRFAIRPRYSRAEGRPLLGFSFGSRQQSVSAVRAASLTVSGLWSATKANVTVVARIFEPQVRRQTTYVVGGY